MFLPLGDDVNKRTLPIVGILIILLCTMVYAHEFYLYGEDFTKNTNHVRNFFNQFGLRIDNLKEGAYIGLLTHMFVHADLFHLVGNMLIFWALVGTLEVTMGGAQLAFWYLVWGFAAAGAQMLANPYEKLPMVGASGAISGVIGAYFVAFGALTKLKALFFLGPFPMRIDLPAGLYVGLWVASQFGGLAEAEQYGTSVAYWAHLGGFGGGVLTGFVMLRQMRSKISVDQHGQLQTEHDDIQDDGLSPAARAILVRQQMEDAAAARRQEAESWDCPHCATTVTAANKIADKMFRCPNERCKRLIYG